MKRLKLKEGDFFHVEVIESEDGETIKLEIKDGPLKGHYLHIDIIGNPCLEEENICEICEKPLSGIEIGTGTGLAHEACYYSPAGKQLLFKETQKIINDIIHFNK